MVGVEVPGVGATLEHREPGGNGCMSDAVVAVRTVRGRAGHDGAAIPVRRFELLCGVHGRSPVESAPSSKVLQYLQSGYRESPPNGKTILELEKKTAKVIRWRRGSVAAGWYNRMT
jgi:hypothetical protein